MIRTIDINFPNADVSLICDFTFAGADNELRIESIIFEDTKNVVPIIFESAYGEKIEEKLAGYLGEHQTECYYDREP